MVMLSFKIIAQVFLSKCLYCISVLIAKVDQVKQVYAYTICKTFPSQKQQKLK